MSTAQDYEMTNSPGGFFRSFGLPSPSPSYSSTSSSVQSQLPNPRMKALPWGSRKEYLVRRYAEQRLAHISRRFVKKFGIAEPDDDVVGYSNFREVCRDLQDVVNVLWRSGTPTLQIPILLKIASDFTQYVGSFVPAPKTTTFALLRRLDYCFASLLCGRDLGTDEGLPGFERGLQAGMTVTDMVRCRGIVEKTRILIAEIMSKAVSLEEDENEEEEEDEVVDDDMMMDIGLVYRRTIEQLGERLDTGLSGTAAD